MTDTPQWAFDRANELTEECPAFHNGAYLAFVKYIAEHEDPPVDPLLQQARDIAAEVYHDAGYVAYSGEIRKGRDDHSLAIKIALTALKAREPSQ